MFSAATILVHREESLLDLQLARLIEYWGIDCSLFRLGQAENQSALPSLLQDNPHCVFVSADTIAAMVADPEIPREAIATLFGHTPFVLIYGITPGEKQVDGLRLVTGGLLSSVVGFDGSIHQYHVSPDQSEITSEFSGLTFGPIHNDIDFGLVFSGRDATLSSLVSIEKLPFFASLKKSRASIFLLGCSDVVDLQSQTDGSFRAHSYFSRLVPILMFLKFVYGDRIWTNPNRCASFVIDDPLLRRSYGFLNYSRLLKEMNKCDFAATMAFIPWNHTRTHRSTAELFRHSDRLSICVHGCDHTAGEFASNDPIKLNTQIHLATERMRDHEQRTGVPFDDVMVFPQGRFSSVSLSVLKGHNYLAAVNSSVIAGDLPDAHGFTVRDFLAPAICKYSTFPLFIRRYPEEPADFAFDLFLGKPALLVEHHSYFKDGYERIRDFTIRLNALSSRLKWMSIGQVIKRTYVQKRVSPDTIACTVYGNRQVIHNTEHATTRFLISKPEDSATPIQHVSVNGAPHPYTLDDSHLRLAADVPAAGTIELAIAYRNTLGSIRDVQPVGHRVKVGMRRYLSEVRDNHLSKHDRLLSMARHLIKRTSLGL